MPYSRLALLVSLYCLSFYGQAQQYNFDPALLGETGADQKKVDLSLFDQGGQLPGTYTVDILLNGDDVETSDVTFSLSKDTQGKPTLVPCLSVEQLARFGIKVGEFTDLAGPGNCARLEAIPGGTARFDFNAQALKLGIPQIYLVPKQGGIAPEILWNDGVSALLMNYQANSSRTDRDHSSETSSFIQLQPGANFGPWRLRNATSWQQSGTESGKWESAYTYAERGLNGIKSRLTLGERDTPADIFDSVPFRGAMLNSDESMVPGTMSSFAPVIRGIARTQARVEVKQNGYTLYNATVAPGPFALTDLTPSGSGGDFQVTVWETDGNAQHFTVPYQTAAIALREGYLKYSTMAGQYRSANRSVDHTPMMQTTLMYGLPWNLTAYSGLQGAEHFQAMSLGLGMSLGYLGALSVDGTQSRGARYHEDYSNGQTWRVRYSKDVLATATSLTLASYQYSSSGYSTLADVLDTYRTGSPSYAELANSDRRKARTSLSISQSMKDYGFLTFGGYQDTYWNRPGHTNSLNVGYSINFKAATVSLNWAENQTYINDNAPKTDRVTSLWVSVPLGRWLGGDTQASYRYTSPSSGSDGHELGLNGRGFDRRLQWDVRQGYQPDGEPNRNSALNLSWNGTYGQVGGNYSYSPGVRQMGANVSGGVLVHPHGVTLSQQFGDTVTLVEAPGANGVRVSGWPGVKTDYRGYTALSYATPYQKNVVSLNPTDLPANAEITQTDVSVVPTKGAVIAAKFATRVGGRALMNINQANGEPVPYGALTTLEGEGVGAGVVGENGQVYLTGLPDKGLLTVKWAGHHCQVSYVLPAETGPAGLYNMTNQCH